MSDRAKNFIRGAASVLDVFSNRSARAYPVMGSQSSDGAKLRGDWVKVGGDIRKSMDVIKNERAGTAFYYGQKKTGDKK